MVEFYGGMFPELVARKSVILESCRRLFYAIAHEYEGILFDMSHEFSQNIYIP